MGSEGQRVDELIAAQARQRPDAVAVVSDEEHVSYGALNRRANQLAHYLQRRGIGAESVVGVAVASRSAEMVVALLGILKAGGAYLPLDVEQPASRLRDVWRDSGAQLLLSGQRVKEELSEKLGEELVTVLCVADEWEVVQRESAAEPESGAGGENRSHVIYTSGSTGQAKGVGITHRGPSNLAVAQGQKFGLGRESRVSQFAVLSFDASVSEIFTTLSSGGVLHLGGREAEHRRGQLMRVLREEQITVVTLPPALLAVTRAEELPALETLVVAGEACPWEVAERWSSGRRLLNAYGPTETTVCATMHEWAGESVASPRRGTVSIGVPMANMEVYVLDEGQQLVGVGVSGGTVYRGAGSRARLPGAGGVDGGEVYSASVQWGSGSAAVPQWRCSALSGRGRVGVYGPGGRSGEGAGPPGRVGGGGSSVAARARGEGSSGGRARGAGGREAVGGLCGERRRVGGRSGVESAAAGAVAGVHGAVGSGAAGGDAGEPARQD